MDTSIKHALLDLLQCFHTKTCTELFHVTGIAQSTFSKWKCDPKISEDSFHRYALKFYEAGYRSANENHLLNLTSDCSKNFIARTFIQMFIRGVSDSQNHQHFLDKKETTFKVITTYHPIQPSRSKHDKVTYPLSRWSDDPDQLLLIERLKKTTGVYALYDHQKNISYVGKTMDSLWYRIAESHSKLNGSSSYFSAIQIDPKYAEPIEAVIIELLHHQLENQKKKFKLIR